MVLYRAGESVHQGRLNIYGRPMVRPFPNPVKAVEGKDFVIHCPVSGYPIEDIAWSKGMLEPLAFLNFVGWPFFKTKLIHITHTHTYQKCEV